jgi:hypothetical protein
VRTSLAPAMRGLSDSLPMRIPTTGSMPISFQKPAQS